MIELLSNSQMAEADRLAIAGGVPGIELMENAGRAVADRIEACWPLPVRVLVVAGGGNNGGDGFVVARHLANRGYKVRVLLAGDPAALRGDAAEMAARWKGATESATPEAVFDADLIVDALFGAGLQRPVEGLARRLIEAMNAGGVPVVAIDLPSGISGTTGAVMGAAVRATETVTFFHRKPGHLLLPGRLHCGRVTLADIGIPAKVLEAIAPKTSVNAPPLWQHLFPVPRLEGHKYSRGHVLVGSGGALATGAARLTARAALRAGAGLVTIASPAEAAATHAATNTAIMVRLCDDGQDLGAILSDHRFNSVVLGPGAGRGARLADQVTTALAHECHVVLDADALTSFVENREYLFTALRKRADRPAILTPHSGEFSRLFSEEYNNLKVKQKLEGCLEASHETGAIVVLKGADTVVAAPDGRAAIAENAPPWLATAGSGDVLAGIIAGLAAQGVPPFEAACAGVWVHGEAAAAFGPGLISEDLPEHLPGVYRKLFAAIGGVG